MVRVFALRAQQLLTLSYSAAPHQGGAGIVPNAQHDMRDHATVRICRFSGRWTCFVKTIHVLVPPEPTETAEAAAEA